MVSIEQPEAKVSASHIVEDYGRAYQLAYGQKPRVRYMGNQWFNINGQMVHYSFLESETTRLTGMARARHRSHTDKNVVSRIIAKLRAL